MQQLIRTITDKKRVYSNHYGNKAAILSKIAKKDGIVPSFFLLSKLQTKKIALNKVSNFQLKKLQKKFKAFLSSSKSRTLIVRSSSIHEDSLKASFAGLFNSKKNINSFSSLIEAVTYIYTTAINNRSVKDYAHDFNIDVDDAHIGLIIQEQIKCDISGIAYVEDDCVFIEYNFDELDVLISGEKKSKLSAFFKINNEVEIIDAVNFKKVPQSLINSVMMLFNSAKTFSFKQVVLEFGISNNRPFIFQLRPTKSVEYKQIIKSVFPEDDENIGNKALAMRFFSDNKMFTKNFLLFNSSVTNEDIIRLIKSKFTENDLLTIRYSFKDSISLPRKFIRGASPAFDEIISNKPDKWTSIVHDYINVKRSFELIIDYDKWTLEHIPGLWESENTLNPDAIHSDKDNIKIWRYKHGRLAKYQDEISATYAESFACSMSTLELWAYKTKSLVKILRGKFEERMPINVHFVEDENGEWQFINIRPAFKYAYLEKDKQNLFNVSSIKDLSNWDKKSELVLKVAINRGDESSLLALALALPKDKIIYVDFGMLSHPAMVLREYGCNLMPSYLLSSNQLIKANYDLKTMQGDILYEPYDRIMLEKPIILNKHYMLVYDKNKISESHTLIVAKQKISSIADGTQLPELITLLNTNNKHLDDTMYFERGRAQFCTSGFTTEQAHAHLFKEREFNKNIILDFSEFTNAIQAKSLLEALKLVKDVSGEYLVFGSKKQGYFYRTKFESNLFEKRCIRNFLTNNMKNMD